MTHTAGSGILYGGEMLWGQTEGRQTMRTTFVFTLTGPDRVGIVEEVTELLLGLGGNVETSRMAHLGGDFAILMLVTMPTEQFANLDETLGHLAEHGYKVTATETHEAAQDAAPGRIPYRIQVSGADHEGIIHNIARGLSRQGINIESMDTGTSRAPVSGTQLFSMNALVVVPAELAGTDWIAALKDAGDRSNVDVLVTPTEHD